MEDIEAISWKNAREEDLWIFDKLIVSRKLGYTCGPVGVDVPAPGMYIVRPCVNIPGMGRGAKFEWIVNSTFHLPPGHFWCEIFEGRHLSIDYTKLGSQQYKQVLAVEGFKNPNDPIYRFSKWEKVDDIIPMPPIFLQLLEKYEYVNIEYIGNRAIEIHFRHNPDFVHGNSVAYPVWKDDPIMMDMQGLRYIEAPDYHRKGFWID
jgi:hypothetical protein